MREIFEVMLRALVVIGFLFAVLYNVGMAGFPEETPIAVYEPKTIAMESR